MKSILSGLTGQRVGEGVKANVLFFEKKPASETAWTKKLWVCAGRILISF